MSDERPLEFDANAAAADKLQVVFVLDVVTSLNSPAVAVEPRARAFA